ncbi:endothelin-converting enzyme-like 1 [Ixodes scapularis]|uniref:endothelin-converting enzyme-like 1 n=1 Tax=Ixodes scapularis TaxID=6945 RepID=UPI001AD6A498|nr:endothelin-converting enzyme-like 1 [Ixodes scapularis]
MAAVMGFWERSTPLEQWLVVLCMAVVIAVCIMLTYTFYYAREYSKTERLKQVEIEYYECGSAICNNAVIELKETLNFEMSPCKNFYEYVCSLWPSRYPMPDDAGVYSARDDVRERQRKKLIPPLIKGQLEDQRFTDERSAVHLFQSCNNIQMRATEGVQPVLDILRGMGLGDWPYSPGAGLPGAEAIVELGAATYGFPFFLSLRVAPDPRRSRENLVHVDLPEMVLHSNFLLLRDVGGYAALMKAYAAYAVRTLSLLGVHGAPEQVFADVLQYEIAMAEHASHRTLRELTEFKPENIVSLNSLEPLHTSVRHCKALLARMVRDIYQIADVPISHSEEILVWNMTFVGALDQFFEGEKQRWLLNYLGWRVAEVLGPASSVELLGARHAFLMAKYGADDAPQLAVHCFEEVSRLLPIPMGRMAFRAQADGATFQKLISRMVAEIRASLLLLLEGSDIRWLTDESKAIATEKIRKLKLIQQPYNSTLIDWETPDVLLYGESYVNNLILLQTSKATQEWKGLSRHNSLDTVAVPQLRMSVSYDVYRNAIVVPALIARPSILTPELSPSINFGAFGYLVAHEMLRGIMFSGSVIDEQGSLRNWHTRARFDILVNCFGTMLRHTITNEIMNRVRSSSVALSQMFNRELIIGSTALPAAFKAFRTFMARYEGESEFSALPRVRFTQNQLFFLYFAKSWCHTKRKTYESYYIEDSNEPPPDLRVNHILMDFEKFGKTFECQLGTVMTPHFKCGSW